MFYVLLESSTISAPGKVFVLVKVFELTRLGRGRIFGRTPRRLGPRAKALCIDARHAKAALNTAPNKTDASDADGLALLAEAGFFREVRVKSSCGDARAALLGGRSQLIGISTEFSIHMRGVTKTFELVATGGTAAGRPGF